MFLFIGIAIAFFGLQYIKLTFFFAGLLVGTAASFVIFFIKLFCVDFVLNANSKNSTLWICLFVSIILGSIVGFFTYKIRKLGTFAIGGWLGYVISLICYSSFMYKI